MCLGKPILGEVSGAVFSLARRPRKSATPQLENARLSYQAELAQDYFELRGTDGEKELLETTVKSYQDYLKLTQDRFNSGVASGSDVAQAQTQLETARAQLIDYDVARAQYEHAIAVLAGKAPAEVTISYRPIKITPPPVPVGAAFPTAGTAARYRHRRTADGRGQRADWHCQSCLLPSHWPHHATARR